MLFANSLRFRAYLTHDVVQSVTGKVMLAVTAAEAERRLLTHKAP